MKENIKFFTIFALWCVALWYVCEGLLWLEFLLKPYTHFTKIMMTWVQHIIFLTVVPFWATLITLAISAGGKKKKRG